MRTLALVAVLIASPWAVAVGEGAEIPPCRGLLAAPFLQPLIRQSADQVDPRTAPPDIVRRFTSILIVHATRAGHGALVPAIAKLDIQAVRACVPRLEPPLTRLVVAEEERQAALAEAREEEARKRDERIEMQRRQLEAMRAEEERRRAEEDIQRRAADAAAAQEERRRRAEIAEARKPPNVLRRAYAHYIYIRRCVEAREGYAVVYISEAELTKAREAVAAIQERVAAIEPSVDTAALWDEANKIVAASRQPMHDLCRAAFNELVIPYRAVEPPLSRDF